MAQGSPPSRRPLILSASRRTDLPGWYAGKTAGRIRNRVKRARVFYLYGVTFWTRFPMNLVRGPLSRLIADELDNVAVNLTVNGFGGTPLEPRAPRTNDVISSLPDLVALLGGQGARIRWRFDPLLYKHSRLETFTRLADVMAGLGISTCTFSFPAERSLRGSLAQVYAKAGLESWPGDEAKADFLGRMAAVAKGYGLRLLSCAQPHNLELCREAGPAQCIPLEVLRDLHPQGLPYPDDKDPSQRGKCNCPVSEDIGRYGEDLCRTGCAYCYSPSGGAEPLRWKPQWPFGQR